MPVVSFRKYLKALKSFDMTYGAKGEKKMPDDFSGTLTMLYLAELMKARGFDDFKLGKNPQWADSYNAKIDQNRFNFTVSEGVSARIIEASRQNSKNVYEIIVQKNKIMIGVYSKGTLTNLAILDVNDGIEPINSRLAKMLARMERPKIEILPTNEPDHEQILSRVSVDYQEISKIKKINKKGNLLPLLPLAAGIGVGSYFAYENFGKLGDLIFSSSSMQDFMHSVFSSGWCGSYDAVIKVAPTVTEGIIIALAAGIALSVMSGVYDSCVGEYKNPNLEQELTAEEGRYREKRLVAALALSGAGAFALAKYMPEIINGVNSALGSEAGFTLSGVDIGVETGVIVAAVALASLMIYASFASGKQHTISHHVNEVAVDTGNRVTRGGVKL